MTLLVVYEHAAAASGNRPFTYKSQVITSMLNVVKELVENSLDAGASRIEVNLDDYGFDRIELIDNGIGIEAADEATHVIAVKHYTSKISSHDDLESLETYGFRGELLCTVSEAIVWQKARVSDHKMALVSVLGTALMSSMLRFQHHQMDPEVTLNGFLPKPGSDNTLTSSSSSDKTFIFTNQRPVHLKEVLKLVRQFYSLQSCRQSSHSRCPVLFMNIVVPAASADIKVMLQNKENTSVLLSEPPVSFDKTMPTEPLESTSSSEGNCQIIKNACEFGVTFTLDDERIFMDTQQGNGLKSAGENGLQKKPGVVMDTKTDGTKDFSEMTAESWSMGHTLKDSNTGEKLEPVKVFVPHEKTFANQNEINLQSSVKSKQ
ncbi:PMS1 protein-like 1 [Acipenser ruthenus]|uniref:PMS1 protein-like 1 n=1 Tax=Acipenser ruthenus TaxID=7906 RepID=A0A444UQ40_ACIRT|nr:PMS1 protein-like 1 [Acipenser ruthenus]